MNKLNPSFKSLLLVFTSLATIFVFIGYYSSIYIAGAVTMGFGVLFYFNPKLLDSPYLKNERNGFVIVSIILLLVFGIGRLFRLF
jgi:hypothetical protein